MGINEFIARSRVVHGAVYDYSKVAYMAGDSAVTIVCPSHGEFQQKPRVHLSGSGCKHCYLVRNRSNKDEFIQQAIKTHGDRYDYSNVVYTTSKEKVEVICFEHGSFWITPNSHTSSGGGCPRCKESKGETRIRVFLERHGINHVQEYKVDPYLYRYDFFLPDYGLLIEYQGQQHFKPVERFGGELYFKQTVESDKVKKVIAEQGGYSLLRLGYWLSKHEGVEIALETVLRATGHTFDESLTITNTWSA
jgi:very-short-patch-repair endonuclease